MSDRIKIPAAFWLGVDRLTVGRSALLRAAGLPIAVGQDDAVVTTAQFFSLWNGLEKLVDQDAGLKLGQAVDTPILPPSFLVAYHAKDLRDALQRVARFKSLCAPEVLTIAEQGNACVIESHWPIGDAAVPASLIDATMVSIVGLARSGADERFRPKRIELRRRRSEAIAAFYGCPIGWNADHDRLILNASDLDLPFGSYNRELLAMLDGALAGQLDAQAAQSSLTDQVRWLLRRALTAGRPELRSIARELAISERSLQRRLSEEGRGFQALLSDTRHELALEYLRDPRLDLSEIAYMLGYENQGSFFRAFQDWEDKTPSEWRHAASGN